MQRQKYFPDVPQSADELGAAIDRAQQAQGAQGALPTNIITYPQDGSRLVAIKPGRTVIDLLQGQVLEPDGTPRKLKFDAFKVKPGQPGRIRSGVISLDNTCLVEPVPSTGGFMIPGGTTLPFQGVNFQQVIITLPVTPVYNAVKGRACAALFVFAEQELALAFPALPGITQSRFSGASPVASTDSWAGVPVIPVTDTLLAVAAWGNPNIECRSFPKKTFVVREAGGVNAAQARVVGRFVPEVGTQYVDSSVAPLAGGVVTIPAGEYRILETSVSWVDVQLEIKSLVSGSAGAVTVEYAGHTA